MQAEERQHKYPHVADFLEYVKFRWMVSFRKLADPKARPSRIAPCFLMLGNGLSTSSACRATAFHSFAVRVR